MHFHTRVKAFAVDHDDLASFHLSSIVLTVIAAAFLNTGAFAVLILAHAVLDIVKYREADMRWTRTALATFREGLLDLFFLALSICFALYLHHGQSIFVVSRLILLEEFILRTVGIGLARFEILLHGLWVFSNVHQHLREVRASAGPWRTTERLCLTGFLLATAFILLSPLVMEPGALTTVFFQELVPWRP